MEIRHIACAILAFASYGLSQQPPAHADHGADAHATQQAASLRLTSTISLPAETNRPLYRPSRCDKNGNIYFRGYQLDDRKIPITRVNAKGTTTTYKFDSEAEFSKGASYDFSVL